MSSAATDQGNGLRLVPVDDGNRAAVARLSVDDSQTHFVASNRDSLEEAMSDPDARPRVILADGLAVGFLMYDAAGDEAKIYRFMIDQAHQGRGYGRAALQAALAEIRNLDHVQRVTICYEPENEAARGLYRAAGFIEQGLDEDGEMIASLAFTRQQGQTPAEQALNDAMAAIAPRGVRTACRIIRRDDAKLLMWAEADSIRARQPKTRDASGAARHVARELLAGFGHAGRAIPRGPSGAPVWPDGIAASLAHDDDFAVAAAASVRDIRAIGIDIEPAEPLPGEVSPMVFTQSDVTGTADPYLAGRLVFAAKEAVYKASFPLDGTMLDYEDVTVDLAARRAVTGAGQAFELAFIIAPRIVVIAWVA